MTVAGNIVGNVSIALFHANKARLRNVETLERAARYAICGDLSIVRSETAQHVAHLVATRICVASASRS